MQGWYDQCWSQQPFSTTKAGLPAGDDWYVQRKTGHVFVRVSYETTTPTANRPADWRALMNQVPETTQTPTATRPADWRALMNQVPESPQLLGRSQPQTRTVAAFDNGVGPGQNLYDVVSG